MSIAYCDNCGEIITNSGHALGEATLCVDCSGTSSAASSQTDPSKESGPFASTTDELSILASKAPDPGATQPTTNTDSDPYAPSDTLVMTAQDLQRALETESSLVATPAKKKNFGIESTTGDSAASDLPGSPSSNSELESVPSLIDDTNAPPDSSSLDEDYSMSSMLENEDLDLFSSDTIARRKAQTRSGTRTNLSLIDDDPVEEDDCDASESPSQPEGMEVFNETLRLTGEVDTTARTPDRPRPATDPAPPTHAIPTSPPIETPWPSLQTAAESQPSIAASAAADCDAPPTAILQTPGPDLFGLPAEGPAPVSETAVQEPPPQEMPAPKPPVDASPSVSIHGDKWRLDCVQCSSKLALLPVAQRSRITCPRCSACIRISADGTYVQVETQAAVPGQRLAHVAPRTTSLPPPQLGESPATPAARMETLAPAGPSRPIPSPLIPPPRVDHDLASSPNPMAPDSDRLYWSMKNRREPAWLGHLRDIGWLVALVTPLSLGALMLAGVRPLEFNSTLANLGAHIQAATLDLLQKLSGG